MDALRVAALLMIVGVPRAIDAHVLAYLDPGSGSLAIQALIAGALTVPFILRRRLKAGIDRLRNRRPESERPRADQTPR